MKTIIIENYSTAGAELPSHSESVGT